MKTILKQVLVTPNNYRRICARIMPQDQRDVIRPGIVVSHYAFTNQLGQQGHIIISHTTRRAGIGFAEERTEWGRWDEEAGTIITDGGRLYSRAGELLFDAGNQLGKQSDAPH